MQPEYAGGKVEYYTCMLCKSIACKSRHLRPLVSLFLPDDCLKRLIIRISSSVKARRQFVSRFTGTVCQRWNFSQFSKISRQVWLLVAGIVAGREENENLDINSIFARSRILAQFCICYELQMQPRETDFVFFNQTSGTFSTEG